LSCSICSPFRYHFPSSGSAIRRRRRRRRHGNFCVSSVPIASGKDLLWFSLLRALLPQFFQASLSVGKGKRERMLSWLCC
jgi:hypothetical protein